MPENKVFHGNVCTLVHSLYVYLLTWLSACHCISFSTFLYYINTQPPWVKLYNCIIFTHPCVAIVLSTMSWLTHSAVYHSLSMSILCSSVAWTDCMYCTCQIVLLLCSLQDLLARLHVDNAGSCHVHLTVACSLVQFLCVVT